MWKDYSAGLLKNNRSAGLSVRVAVFISALLLSLLCGLFYNAWKYETERIEREEGGWQSRIMGEFDEQDIESVKNFASVEKVIINEKESRDGLTAADIYFHDMRKAFSDTPRIAALAGADSQKTVYNYELLAIYLIRDKSDTAPRLLFPMYLVIMALASISLIVIIHSAFAVCMNAGIHQLGIFASVGAAPKQIRTCLLHEAAYLSAVPLLAGNLLGIAGSMGLTQITNVLMGSETGRHKSVPGYHPLVFALTLLVTILTIWISAWLPARKLSRMTPLEAVKYTVEPELKRRKKSRVLSFLFGAEGELAGNALKAQRKALRTASLSLVCSFMAFTIMLCFISLSEISTEETYFERYQDAWDIMVTVKDAQADTFELTDKVQELDGVESAAVYQKAAAKRMITEEEISEEMKAIGGFSHALGRYVTKLADGWLVNAPVVILDDNSFSAYCEQLGIVPQTDKAVIRNQIRDVTNPDFRHPEYMPYIREPDSGSQAVSVLRQSGNEEITAEIPVLAYTDQVPVLREEYASPDDYELVHFMPASLWKEIREKTGGAEKELYIRVLCRKNVTLEELNTLQSRIEELINPVYLTESENRIQKYETNSMQIQAVKILFGAFCVLLALIGIGNVFSNTLGFVHQRKREVARYMSVGMTPKEIRKMFYTEALVLAARPVLITLPLAAAAVIYMLRISYLSAGEFLPHAPFVPILIFMLAFFGAIAAAYSLAWKSVRKMDLAEILKDDTMM